MNRHLSLAVSSVVLFWGLGEGALAESSLSFNSNVELDTDFVSRSQDDFEANQGGRVELNVLGERGLGDYFIRGKGTAVLRRGGDLGTDDMYAQFGSSLWDLRLGRFEAADLFPEGQGHHRCPCRRGERVRDQLHPGARQRQLLAARVRFNYAF